MSEKPEILRNLREVDPRVARALTIGNFDGVHAGHRRILRRLVAVASARSLRPAALTFDPHPAAVLSFGQPPRLLTSLGERAQLMAEEGIEELIVAPFDHEFAALAPSEFFERILVRSLNSRAVLVGDDFRFGASQSGNIEILKSLGRARGIYVEAVPEVSIRRERVSSSRIRSLLLEGQVGKAARMLERPYWLEGVVVPGDRIGSTFTVPTLNLAPPSELIPARGVYITKTRDLGGDRVYPSVTNIGTRPTFGASELRIETHLLEPPQPTPVKIRVQFLKRLRDERQFASPEDLRKQIFQDITRARRYFRLCQRLLYSKVPSSDQ